MTHQQQPIPHSPTPVGNLLSIVKVSGPDWIVHNGTGLVVFPDIAPKYAAASATDPLSGEEEHISAFCRKNSFTSRPLDYVVRFFPLEGNGPLFPQSFGAGEDSTQKILVAIGDMNHLKCNLDIYFTDGLSWEARHSFHRSDDGCFNAEKVVLELMYRAFETTPFKSERDWISMIKDRLELMRGPKKKPLSSPHEQGLSKYLGNPKTKQASIACPT